MVSPGGLHAARTGPLLFTIQRAHLCDWHGAPTNDSDGRSRSRPRDPLARRARVGAIGGHESAGIWRADDIPGARDPLARRAGGGAIGGDEAAGSRRADDIPAPAAAQTRTEAARETSGGVKVCEAPDRNRAEGPLLARTGGAGRGRGRRAARCIEEARHLGVITGARRPSMAHGWTDHRDVPMSRGGIILKVVGVGHPTRTGR
ncbi:hypothetical protein T484DRAFT_1934094 [Baffinella frigidus]|nr:hypothetical protein T484DRAFT_1934094 [Cryptophyta sp. CCMP2293]